MVNPHQFNGKETRKKMKISTKATAIALAIFAAAIAPGAQAAGTINGAGGTANYPVLSAWAQDYKRQTGTAVNYQAIGSGGGIKQIKARTVDFANSDKPLMHDELAANHLVQFPQTIISIVPIVHLPDVKAGQLVLDGKTLAGIYLGNITKWNDPAIQKLNPKTRLPGIAIIPVHRSDGSGTTFNFTNYLSKVSPAWKAKIGSDTAVSWPGGIGGKGNAGVAASVTRMMGAIGYVEYAYARQSNLTYTDMINASGARVQPTMDTFQAAALGADFSHVRDFYLIPTNQPGKNSWPITAATYMLMRSDYAADRNHGVLKFLDWALRNGQPQAEKLGYVPIPEETRKLIEASWTAGLKAWP
jgi:phosphate transport system substrate-binding protein